MHGWMTCENCQYVGPKCFKVVCDNTHVVSHWWISKSTVGMLAFWKEAHMLWSQQHGLLPRVLAGVHLDQTDIIKDVFWSTSDLFRSMVVMKSVWKNARLICLRLHDMLTCVHVRAHILRDNKKEWHGGCTGMFVTNKMPPRGSKLASKA